MKEEIIKALFDERKEHFAKEKLFLANKFGEFLIERIKSFGGNVLEQHYFHSLRLLIN
jgi:hypothetical protein